MLNTTFSLLALLPLTATPGDSHGKLTWFEGSYEALLAEAAKTERPIFLDFYTDLCAPCRLLDGQTFSDPVVVTAMSEFLCFAVDGNDLGNKELSESMRVTLFPTLVFLDPKGAPVDKFEGFQPPRSFIAEIERIRSNEGTIPGLRAKTAATPTDIVAHLDLALKLRAFGQQDEMNQAYSAGKRLIISGTGFDKNDVEARFEIGKRLQTLGDLAGWTEQVHAIKALDPEGKSRPMRRLVFEQAAEHARTSMDDTDLRQVLANETDAEMLHQGWHAISNCENFRAQRAKMKRKPEEATEHRKLRRQALREAFKHCPPTESLTYGIFVAQLHLDELKDLADDEKPAALEIARKVAGDASNDAECLDVFAQWLALTGDRAQALEIAKRCVKLDPARMRWRGRVAELEAE